MEAWRRILADSIVKPKDLADRLGVDAKEIEAIVGDYPMRITPTVMATMKEKGDAIWKQVVPDIVEMDDFEAEDDPLEEDLMSPVPHLVHRYPDRVLFLVTDRCAAYCRYCTRSRVVSGAGEQELHTDFEEALVIWHNTPKCATCFSPAETR